jgi:hypothetical protein
VECGAYSSGVGRDFRIGVEFLPRSTIFWFSFIWGTCDSEAHFIRAEISGKKVIFVVGLYMIAKGIPAVIFWTIHQTGPYWIYPVK